MGDIFTFTFLTIIVGLSLVYLRGLERLKEK